jgi:hypothetical protein
MPWVGFEPKIPVPELTKTVPALDRAATVIGISLSSEDELQVYCRSEGTDKFITEVDFEIH